MAYSKTMVENFKEAFALFDVDGHGISPSRTVWHRAFYTFVVECGDLYVSTQ